MPLGPQVSVLGKKESQKSDVSSPVPQNWLLPRPTPSNGACAGAHPEIDAGRPAPYGEGLSWARP